MSEFKWTDELAKEFAFGKVSGRTKRAQNDLLDQFKASKQPKPEWEILAIMHRGEIAKLMFWPSYSQPHFEYPGQQIALDWALNPNNGCKIHSVKRLSDGEVFTVGDAIDVGHLRPFNINRFEPIGNTLLITWGGANGAGLSSLKKWAGYPPMPIPVFLYPHEMEKLKELLK